MKYFTIMFIILLFISQFASADIQKLLSSPTRPTIADIEREMSAEDIAQNPLPNCEKVYTPILDRIANLVAELEWAYPGGIYMPLGRDVVEIGDAVDAFYRSQGQPGRVIRLNASGQSLKVSEEMIARFVQSSGVDIKNLAEGPSYIFFDGSSYRLPNISQSTKIMTAVYKEYVRRGGHAKDILTKFNFFNLHPAGNEAVKVEPSLDRNEFLRKEWTYLKDNPHNIPNRTFASSIQPYGSNEWHSNFLLLQEMPDGSVIAPHPKEPHPLDTRKHTLTSMRMIMRGVAEPEFIAKVQSRAKELGYDFKLKQNCDQVIGTLP